MAVDDPILDLVGKPGGPLADAASWSLTVSTVASITSDYRRVTFEGPGLDQLRFSALPDRISCSGSLGLNSGRRTAATPSAAPTRRRRRSPSTWWSTEMDPSAAGPATPPPGHGIDAIGPRGKIWLDDSAEWHLFIGDETALPGMSIMAETLAVEVPGVMVVELPKHVADHDPALASDQGVTITWIERGDDEAGEPARLVAAAEQIALPPGRGHAYVAGEMRVVRAVAGVLKARGLDASAVAAKAYWRRDSANAPHGEPLDPEGPRADLVADLYQNHLLKSPPRLDCVRPSTAFMAGVKPHESAGTGNSALPGLSSTARRNGPGVWVRQPLEQMVGSLTEARVDSPMVRQLRASYEMVGRLRLTHQRPPFRVESVEVDGKLHPVREELVMTIRSPPSAVSRPPSRAVHGRRCSRSGHGGSLPDPPPQYHPDDGRGL